jgi:transposase
VKRRNHDWIHKLTTAKAKSHGLIGVEGLRIKGMTASARGTAEEPGTNVAQKAGLNRSLLGASPRMTRTMLAYKGDRYGCLVVSVPPAYISQYCSACRRHPKDDPTTAHQDHGRISQAEFVCPLCGHAMNADHNAARNIRYGALVLAGWVEDPTSLERLRRLGAVTVAEATAEKANKAAKLAARKAKAAATKAATLNRKRQDKEP